MKDGVVTWTMFMAENIVMWAILLIGFICLTIFVVLYKNSIEEDDVCIYILRENRHGLMDRAYCKNE